MKEKKIDYLKIVKDNKFFDLDVLVEDKKMFKSNLKLKIILLNVLFCSMAFFKWFLFIPALILPVFFFYFMLKKESDYDKEFFLERDTLMSRYFEIVFFDDKFDFTTTRSLQEKLIEVKSKSFKSLKKSDLEYALKITNNTKEEADLKAYNLLKSYYEKYSEEKRLIVFNAKVEREAKTMKFSLQKKMKSLIINN